MKKELEFDGETYIIKKPNSRIESEAKFHSGVLYGKALDEGIKSKEQIERMIPKSDVNKDKREELKDRIVALERKILKGGYPKFEARSDAIKTYKLRLELASLDGGNEHYQYTAESIADEGYENYIIHQCCQKENGELVFKSVDNYADRKDEELAKFLRGELNKFTQVSDVLDNLPEIKFLKKYGFMNDNYEYVNEEGKVVDEDYNVVEKDEFVEFT